ncbi:MAG: IS4 family transposase [bacterium]|nr:IS4 family transposase [bacterium]
MDPRIESLKSTTFCGRRLTRRQIAEVQETVALCPSLSRNELAKTICEHLNWTTPKGGYRVAACLRMLETLEECAVLTLPAKRNTIPGPRTPITRTGRSDPGAEIACALAEMEPLSLQPATEERDIADWNELVDRHHGLGCPRPFGPHLRWFVLDRDGRRLGCLLFEAAAKSLPARDAWVGWKEKDRDRRLHLAVSNSRFLILPWVRVDNLASRALSMAARQLPGEWEERHGCRPVLCETFVDPTRFDGACYRAANWTMIGMTAGRRSGRRAKPAKQILVLPLDPGFRAVLKGESKAPPRRKPPAPACDDPYIAMWMKIIDAAAALAAAHDRQWMKRKRVLDSLIVVLFVFRLVLSRGSKGYATVLAELWDQCRKLGIALPQREPVAASSICKARAKVHEDLFLDLHREILRHDCADRRWKGHRTFAVDTTKMSLPRPLAEAGYRVHTPSAYYPLGLVSCLYRLDTGTPVDFSLSAATDERAAALAHLDALQPDDIVVFDRGYFSFALLYTVVWGGAHPVFRICRSSAFDDFINGDLDDTLVSTVPKRHTRTRLRAALPGRRFEPIDLRLVRCTSGDSEYALATTLTDTSKYTLDDLCELYHGRWGIEEMFKTSKAVIAVDEFHSRTERGIRQELYAHFNLIAMTRLLSNRGDGLLEEMREVDKENMTVNFKNALAIMAANLEELVLMRAAVLAETVSWMVQRILAVRSRLRPGRLYPRRSMKPVSKWARRRSVTA